MDDILRALGAVTETESDVQRDVIRERIIDSIVFSDDPHSAAIPTSVQGAPELNETSMRLLISEILREKSDCNGRAASTVEMKLLFIRGLLRLRNIDLDVDSIPPAKTSLKTSVPSSAASSGRYIARAVGVQTMSIEDIKKLPAQPTHHADSGRRSHYRGGGDLGLQDARLQTAIRGNASSQNWNIDSSSIDALNEEARRSSLNSSRFKVEGKCVEEAQQEEEEEEAVEVVAPKKKRTLNENESMKPSTIIEKVSPSSGAAAVIAAIVTSSKPGGDEEEQEPADGRGMKSSVVTCPLCGEEVDVAGRNIAAVMDSHIERCSRRSTTRSSSCSTRAATTSSAAARASSSVDGGTGIAKKRRYSYEEGEDEEEEDWMDEDSSNDDGSCVDKPTNMRSAGGGRLRRNKVKSEAVAAGASAGASGRKSRSGLAVAAAGVAGVASVSANSDSVVTVTVAGKQGGGGRGHKKKKPSVGGLDAVGLGLFDRKANNRGRIQEDQVYFADDWEDDVYLNRLCEIGVYKPVRSDEDGSVDNTRMELVARPFVATDYGTEVDEASWSSLYDYQKEGIRWLYELYDGGAGGILGDEMGLGKTAQLCVHFGSLSRLYRQQQGRSGIFLVVCPATVLQHWLKEFRRWVPEMRCVIMHTISKTGSELHKLGEEGVEYVLRKVQKYDGTRGLIVLVTYEGLRRHKVSLNRVEWTGVCLDEGQKIRNPSADISIVCKMLPSYHRIILSGTPIQNSLKELWSLFDFIYPGRLGTLPVFELEFCEPIRAGGYRNATKLQAEIAVRCAATLQRIVKPYLLRRKKDDLTATTKLPQKTEQVLFCRLSENQRMIYRSILSSDEVSAVLSRRAAPFRAINTLRKLCNHPVLAFRSGRVVWDDLKPAKKNGGGGKGPSSSSSSSESRSSGKGKSSSNKSVKSSNSTGSNRDDDKEKDSDDDDDIGDDGQDLTGSLSSEDLRWEDSGKLMVLGKVLPLWYNEGHKVLLFSQTQSMLNLLEVMLKEFSFRYMRLDGSTPVSRREGIIETFNKDPTVFIMILSTRTGGVGISLTAANRVVLVDPDWNPQTDAQARERAWRIGQQRDVTIYRLICRGTIEEKIYQRQIFKLLLTKRILDDPKQKALFSKSDIKELFDFPEDDDNRGLFGANSSNSNGNGSGNGSTHRNGNGSAATNLSSTSALPREGEVMLGPFIKKPTSSTSSSSSSSSSSATAALPPVASNSTYTEKKNTLTSSNDIQQQQQPSDQHRIRRQEIEEGELSEEEEEHREAGRQEQDLEFMPETETFVEQKLPDAVVNNTADGDDENNKDESNSRDRRLLKALFDGEALAAVYDHSAVEPGGQGSRSSSDMRRVREKASQIVDEALSRVNSSKPVYLLQDDSITGNKTATSSSSLSAGAAATTSSLSSSTNSTGSSTAGGAVAAKIQISSQRINTGAGGSARLLAGLRANQVAGGSSASSSSSSHGIQPASASSSTSSSSSVSVRGNLTSRLIALFRNNSGLNLNLRGTGGLSSDYILQNFRDLGDQYASLFREVLRQVADQREGRWYLRT